MILQFWKENVLKILKNRIKTHRSNHLPNLPKNYINILLTVIIFAIPIIKNI